MQRYKMLRSSIPVVRGFALLIAISVKLALASADLQRFVQPPIDCPGSCTTLLACKSSGGKLMGFCMDGNMCCGAAFNIIPTTGTCGSSVVSRKVAHFRSPNYPGYSGRSMICEFTLQLNPATVGIRMDFLDLSLPTVPSNPLNFYESPNPVCDSDFMIIRGFSGWSPDFRCGNLTGYSFMVERENGQTTLSTVFIMASIQYRWNIQFTEIYYNELESLDYSLRNPSGSANNNNNKKQWIWYPPPGTGISIPLTPPIGLPGAGLPPSLLTPPSSWQYYQPIIAKRDAHGSASESLNSSVSEATTSTLEEIENVHTNLSVDNLHPYSRIVGGVDAKPNSVPWQVSLQLVEKTESASFCGTVKNLSSHFCGGSIIGDRTILTASHCFYSSSRYSHPLIPAAGIKVVVGEHDLCNENEVSSTREYSIERIILHYNYISTDVINDLAVIHLNKPIMFDHNVHPIALADERTKMEILKPLLSGWGSLGVDENSTYPPVLQQSSNIHIFSEKECQHFQREFLEFVYPDSKLSGKYRNVFDHGICTRATDTVTEAGFGDSGGPLSGLSSTGGPPVLLGVVSHMRPHPDPQTGATRCDLYRPLFTRHTTPTPTVLCNVNYFTKFIEPQISQQRLVETLKGSV